MSRNTLTIARGVGVIGATVALMVGATFAALNSTATLTNSSIETTNASLLVWNGSSFVQSAPGFTITGLIPGTGVDENVYFQNAGGTSVNITAHVPVLPGPPIGGYGFSGFNNVKVDVTGERCSTTIHTDLAALNAGDVALPCTMAAGDTANSGVPGTSGNYDFHFDINEAAVTGSSAGVDVFNMDFTGTQTP